MSMVTLPLVLSSTMTEPEGSSKESTPPRTSSELLKVVERDDNSGGVAVFRNPDGQVIYSHYTNVSREQLDKLNKADGIGDYRE